MALVIPLEVQALVREWDSWGGGGTLNYPTHFTWSHSVWLHSFVVHLSYLRRVVQSSLGTPALASLAF